MLRFQVLRRFEFIRNQINIPASDHMGDDLTEHLSKESVASEITGLLEAYLDDTSVLREGLMTLRRISSLLFGLNFSRRRWIDVASVLFETCKPAILNILDRKHPELREICYDLLHAWLEEWNNPYTGAKRAITTLVDCMTRENAVTKLFETPVDYLANWGRSSTESVKRLLDVYKGIIGRQPRTEKKKRDMDLLASVSIAIERHSRFLRNRLVELDGEIDLAPIHLSIELTLELNQTVARSLYTFLRDDTIHPPSHFDDGSPMPSSWVERIIALKTRLSVLRAEADKLKNT